MKYIFWQFHDELNYNIVTSDALSLLPMNCTCIFLQKLKNTPQQKRALIQ